jgi:single-strand DNA-binding protein
MSMNVCVFIGNLTRDPEIREVGDTKVAGFSIAVKKYTKDKDKDEATFLDCEAWGKTAELLEKFFKKGDQIGVKAEAVQDRWEDKTDGSNRSKIKFRVEQIDFGRKSSNNTEDPTNETPKDTKKKSKKKNEDVVTEPTDEEVPF